MAGEAQNMKLYSGLVGVALLMSLIVFCYVLNVIILDTE